MYLAKQNGLAYSCHQTCKSPKSGPTLVLKSASLANLSAQQVQLSNVRKEKKFNSLQKKVFRSRSILQPAEFFFKFTANPHFCSTEVEVISSERESERGWEREREREREREGGKKGEEEVREVRGSSFEALKTSSLSRELFLRYNCSFGCSRLRNWHLGWFSILCKGNQLLEENSTYALDSSATGLGLSCQKSIQNESSKLGGTATFTKNFSGVRSGGETRKLKPKDLKFTPLAWTIFKRIFVVTFL